MSVPLAKPVAAYFRANAAFDVDGMLAPFAEDAVVIDEGRAHRGRAEIRAWIEEATIGNRALAAPQEAAASGTTERVTAEITGAFPGSPITLGFRFTLAGDRIARLEIR